ncbi:MAG: TauD/TfdA family dioxygenase [Burkholderiales bacterium]|nr:TauD/TfdA family dioxygenase [Burkholderiales bacterium]
MTVASSTAREAPAVIQGRVGGIEIIPLPGAMGAEIRGLDLRRLDDDGFGILHRAYLDHLLVLVRGQRLSDGDMVAVARRFGEFELPPVTAEQVAHHTEHPEITVVSNVRVDGAPIGELGDGEVIWHSDYSFRPVIAGMRMLHALEVPPEGEGANTEFRNMYAAWDTLPESLKKRVLGATIKHDTAYDTNRRLRRGAVAVDDPRLGDGPDHPIVSTHPDTGCNSLFLGRRPRHAINGCALEESEALLDALWAHATAPDLGYTHIWREGDVVLWDNRCTIHRRGAFNPAARRVMHATQVRGHRPFEAADAATRPPHPRGRRQH